MTDAESCKSSLEELIPIQIQLQFLLVHSTTSNSVLLFFPLFIMAAKQPSSRWWFWTKVLMGGAVVAVGGPAFTMWLTPTEEELRSRYNPELRKKSLENREERQQEFDDFVTRLKEYSKSDKPSVFVSSSKYQLLT
ncbi:hypothetical protein FOIG_02123 [Fusarium odoratissimum NRRL 54006]|uniref:Cytochrome b mRNA-processing protein 4 n=2 Tax=Fusarium oxysporum species complex TaxID=171631 RepID=X0MMV7_FUSOX|nr:uncharacterized protein FOIG_02123 [Fusarium odoratissimum NRRL 54006]EXM09208.1 hypothetical protein FOIG_02123 [Fusarium odoratissimum NRRL 54006]EXM34761.1 hypothetical protein FOTG_01477 [Fusarium oxysporum f. sp. vasinfectum 25433]